MKADGNVFLDHNLIAYILQLGSYKGLLDSLRHIERKMDETVLYKVSIR